MPSTTARTFLAYYLSSQDRLRVWDAEARRWVSVLAVSGGGRGQLMDGVSLPYGQDDGRRLCSTSYTIKADAERGIRGGPIPPGAYRIHRSATNDVLGRSSFLEPDPANAMWGRDGFFIHGPGPKGSDGCIVPEQSCVAPILDRIDRLCDALEDGIHLRVISSEIVLGGWSITWVGPDRGTAPWLVDPAPHRR